MASNPAGYSFSTFSDRVKLDKLDKLDKRDKRDKREKLEEQEIQVEQPQTSPASVLSVSAVAKTPPAPDLDFSEIAGLQALSEYMAMCPADAGDGFSKKETQEFEDMMLITFT